MIEKKEILNLAKTKGLPVSTIEKDYVLGWFLTAIQNQHDLFNNWAFKGGTCLKKCYLKDYRFSEDLDFSLLDSNHLNEGFLKKALFEISNWLYEEIGLEIPPDGTKIDIYKNRQNKLNGQIRVKFCGPLRPKTKLSWPKIKLDLTADERIVEEPKKLRVFHDYSDEPSEKIYIHAYPIEELFAEKLRALTERCRPRDLYDVIMIFQKKRSF